MNEYHPITALLGASASGDGSAKEELLKLVYDELTAIAQSLLKAGEPSATLQPSDLVHETYLRLLGEGGAAYVHRRHFFSAAARAMKHILIDRYRRRRSLKRGGNLNQVSLDSIAEPQEAAGLDLELLSELLEKFSEVDPRAHQVVELRFFLGLNDSEIGELLEIAPRTVRADWLTAKGWLWQRMSQSNELEE